MNTVMTRLKEIKTARGLSNQDIADMSGVPVGTVGRIFADDSAEPKITTVVQIASGLGVDMNTLCGLAPVDALPSVPSPVARTVEAEQFDKLLELSSARFSDAKEQYEKQIALLQRDKRVLAVAVGVLMLFILCLFTADLMIPTAGWFQRAVAAGQDFLRAL